ncbi:MAG: glycosyltransferase [Candidatus Paceibacterota bacterium]|jgi:glycosyltransferase involved in cell wall biosynthesis
MTNKMEQKLGIAMICDPLGSNNSGSVFSTIRFGKLLKERGHHVIFVTAKTKGNPDESHNHGVKTYRYRGIPLPKGGGWKLAFPTVRELKKVFQEEKINVVHITLPMSGGIAALRAARALDIKIVAHSHSQPENLFMDLPKFIQPTMNNLWNKYLAWMYKKAESLIYPSEFAHSLLHQLSDKDQPFKVISNGINLEHFYSKDIGDFHERFNIPANKIKLLFVGRIYPEKSIDTLIKAIPHIIKKHQDVHVMIVGGGYLKPKLEKLVLDLKMEKHITFLGLVSEEDKVLAYNASDIFVLPSLAELEGMVVLEAMAVGKPIVVADAEMSASRFFVDGNGFLFKSKDHLDLAQQALKLIENANLRKEMGAISSEKIKNYDIHKSVELLEEVYYSALKNKPKK